MLKTTGCGLLFGGEIILGILSLLYYVLEKNDAKQPWG
jgi:hypothetical protein